MPFDRLKTLFSSKFGRFFVMGFAAAQIVLAVRQYYQERRRRAASTPLYARVVNGETHLGWSLILPRRLINDTERNSRYKIVSSGRANYEHTPQAPSDWSILIRTICPMADGKTMISLRRYSTLCPEKVAATLSRIYYSREWWKHKLTCYLNTSNIGTIFQSANPTYRAQYRLVVSHAYRRVRPRVFFLHPPVENADIHSMYIDNNRLFLVLGRWTEKETYDELDEENTTEVLEITIASYSLPSNDTKSWWAQPRIYSISEEGIIIPVGDRDMVVSSDIGHGQMIMVIYNEPDNSNFQPAICVTFGPNCDWLVERLGLWTQRVRNDYYQHKIGLWKLLKMLSSFNHLNPPEERCRTSRMPMIGRCTSMEWFGHGLFAATKDGVFRKWIDPPPFGYIAAETLLKQSTSAEGMNRSSLKKTIGFDVFKEIPEQSDHEQEPPVINLDTW